jgi:hypothetical protein
MEPLVEVTTSGVSAKLLIKDSNGMEGMGGVTGTGPVTFWPGVAIGFAEFGSKNGTGKFGFAMVWPAGTGRTNSGVTITISSVFVLFFCFD